MHVCFEAIPHKRSSLYILNEYSSEVGLQKVKKKDKSTQADHYSGLGGQKEGRVAQPEWLSD